MSKRSATEANLSDDRIEPKRFIQEYDLENPITNFRILKSFDELFDTIASMQSNVPAEVVFLKVLAVCSVSTPEQFSSVYLAPIGTMSTFSENGKLSIITINDKSFPAAAYEELRHKHSHGFTSFLTYKDGDAKQKLFVPHFQVVDNHLHTNGMRCTLRTKSADQIRSYFPWFLQFLKTHTNAFNVSEVSKLAVLSDSLFELPDVVLTDVLNVLGDDTTINEKLTALYVYVEERAQDFIITPLAAALLTFTIKTGRLDQQQLWSLLLSILTGIKSNKTREQIIIKLTSVLGLKLPMPATFAKSNSLESGPLIAKRLGTITDNEEIIFSSNEAAGGQVVNFLKTIQTIDLIVVPSGTMALRKLNKQDSKFTLTTLESRKIEKVAALTLKQIATRFELTEVEAGAVVAKKNVTLQEI